MTSLPVIAPSPCATCRGPCCQGRMVPLTGFDLCRLIDAFGVPWEELAVAGVAFGGGFRLDDSPARWSFRLKQRLSGHCVFAIGGEFVRCAAHGVRPAACRIYPFYVALRDEGPVVALGNNAVCPSAEARAWSERAAPERVAREIEENARYLQLIEAWEAGLDSKRSIGDFLGFVREAL